VSPLLPPLLLEPLSQLLLPPLLEKIHPEFEPLFVLLEVSPPVVTGLFVKKLCRARMTAKKAITNLMIARPDIPLVSSN
jgi:hypothetical protein